MTLPLLTRYSDVAQDVPVELIETWKICDKWDLSIYIKLYKNAKAAHRPYHTRPLWDISRETVCKEALLGKIEAPSSVVEYFGGLGITATIIRNLYHPNSHILYELDPLSCGHLAANGFEVICGDSLQQKSTGDLIDLDFDIFTLHRLVNDKPTTQFVEKMFNLYPKQLIWTDAAVAKLHLNAQNYQKLVPDKVSDLRSYLTAFSNLIYGRYGYSMRAVEYHSGAAYCLWQEGQFPLEHLNKTRASYAGIKRISTAS